MEQLDKHFADWYSHFIGYGYGTGEEPVICALRNFLNNCRDGDLKHAYDYRKIERDIGEPITWLLISVLCRAGIIDYGSSPRFGWLSDEGARLRDFMSGKEPEELAEIANTDEHPCFPNGCNCWPDGWRREKSCHNPFWQEKPKESVEA